MLFAEKSHRCSTTPNLKRSLLPVAKLAAKENDRLKQACAALPSAGITAHGEWRSDLQATGIRGASFAEVEVDVETGHIRPIKMVHVQDGGLPLNRPDTRESNQRRNDSVTGNGTCGKGG